MGISVKRRPVSDFSLKREGSFSDTPSILFVCVYQGEEDNSEARNTRERERTCVLKIVHKLPVVM